MGRAADLARCHRDYFLVGDRRDLASSRNCSQSPWNEGGTSQRGGRCALDLDWRRDFQRRAARLCRLDDAVLAEVTSPSAPAALTIEVTGRQWWWQVRYLSNDPSRVFTTANEIHIPTGVPVKFQLVGGDVIHSFWVPALSGKTDTIPGQTNETWMEAAKPGTYRGPVYGILRRRARPYGLGRCRANTGAIPCLVQSSAPIVCPCLNGKLVGDQADFNTHCGSCHAVRGTDAAGVLGPDLSHLMTRKTIAAATLTNTPENLTRWISRSAGRETRRADAEAGTLDLRTRRYPGLSANAELRGAHVRLPNMNALRWWHRRSAGPGSATVANLENEPGIAGWLATVDHKEIGIRYIVTAFAFLIAGGVEALIFRLQLAGPNLHLLTPEQYDQLFTTHGMTMIFLYAGRSCRGSATISGRLCWARATWRCRG